ncbi:RNA-directed DNA polymerase [Iodobacter fluviatilis]|uniref:Retron-type reverse transcriptase n=1 Tax=Iodobacter fluviatilis TaxID=537 RepID=A0A377SXK3_9NEIS|nr:RNA-directed DNA polymerase [Iodobacter fluviatilis]TCU85506.1 reverse transcriptase (RNA-dependent DNA polymerase) [Iodobacter fluviatilis]STR45046.1 Retron-type reverse transcriptase [Iodobacter fluviatilis]
MALPKKFKLKEPDDLIGGMEIEWFHSTKEKLCHDDVLKGLLDHGLFAEKIPPCFNSVGLAEFASERLGSLLDEADDSKLKAELDKRAHDYLRYEALRDSNIPRHIGVPHPESYVVQALAIAKHWHAIAKHCNQPNPVSSRIYVRHIGGGRIFEMNYKGSERFHLEEDEQKWLSGAQFVVEADVATCFPSIYTHSIPWALHDKPTAKKSSSLNGLAGNLLDKCTQNTRDRQTNGLLIGPHASNIISEIILTKVDADLQKKGHSKFKRHVDDYRCFVASFEDAERFIKDLGLALRAYEMSLNDKKTKIVPLPCPSEANWVLTLNRHPLPKDQELKFTEIRAFLDRALTCAQAIGKSTPLNYAIKVLAKSQSKHHLDDGCESSPRQLSLRAKRMYTQEAMNLALAFQYLVPMLDEYVFTPYWHVGLKDRIADFATVLISLGLKKLYPDVIAHALFLALKYDFVLDFKDEQLIEIVPLDDCIANVLLLEYAKQRRRNKVKSAVDTRAKELKTADQRDKDKQWLLISGMVKEGSSGEWARLLSGIER